jgi:hypothetical protein
MKMLIAALVLVLNSLPVMAAQKADPSYFGVLVSTTGDYVRVAFPLNKEPNSTGGYFNITTQPLNATQDILSIQAQSTADSIQPRRYFQCTVTPGDSVLYAGMMAKVLWLQRSIGSINLVEIRSTRRADGSYVCSQVVPYYSSDFDY